jgi:serine/threonine protein kinase
MQIEQIGKYRVLGKIGQGAMGEVHKGHDPLLNRDVAIKTISASLGADEEIRKRFLNEAQAAAKLNHPNVITVYDFGEEQGKIYMAMELLEGRDLKELIGHQALGDLNHKLDIMEQIADGLAFAHAHDLIHRDVKPANIHIQPSGQVKILDFGLARLSSSQMTRTGMVMGTPHYMSPEQVRGEKVDARSDIFSLGAVFYEILSGHRPFDGDSMHTVLFHVLQDEPEPLRKWVDLPPMLVEIVQKLLAKDRAQRFQSVAHVADAIRAVRNAIATGREAEATLDSELDQPTVIVAEPDPAFRAGARPGPARQVVGAVALDSARSPEPVLERTRRSPQTLTGRSSTQMNRGRSSSSAWPVYAGGAVVLLALVGGGVYFLKARAGSSAAETAAADRGQEQIGALTEALVANQVQLAQKKLDDKSYAAAVAQAERALKLDQKNAAAKKVLDEAQGALRSIEAAAGEARAAVDAHDNAKAAEALWKLLSIDPTHAGAEELAVALDKGFRSQAEEARRLMGQSRGEAERANATPAEAFTEAVGQAKEGESLFGSGAFGRAARKFLTARDGFERARRVARR